MEITITVDEKDLIKVCQQAYDYVWHGDFINEKELYKPLYRIRKAIKFAKINPGKVLDEALQGTKEEIQK